MSKLSIFLRKKLFKAKPSPSQSPSENRTITIAGKPFSPNWPPPPEPKAIPLEEGTPSDSPSESWYGPVNPSISPTLSPPYSYNEPIKKSPLLKKPKRIEDNFKPSQSTRDYSRIIDKEDE